MKKLKVGDTIRFTKRTQDTGYVRETTEGRVIEEYPYFFLVEVPTKTQYFNVTISKQDCYIGAVTIEKIPYLEEA